MRLYKINNLNKLNITAIKELEKIEKEIKQEKIEMQQKEEYSKQSLLVQKYKKYKDVISNKIKDLKPKDCLKLETLQQDAIYTITKIYPLTDLKYAVYIQETKKFYINNYFLLDIIKRYTEEQLVNMTNLIIKTVKANNSNENKGAINGCMLRGSNTFFLKIF